MKGPLSLAQELRAIRGGAKLGSPLKPSANTAESERPWQEDIDRMQQTLQEVLQAISRFSGVELPEGAPDSGCAVGSTSRLDCKTLKDRIRNDLEAFSVMTVSDMSKQAEGRARAALAEIQSELSGQVDRVTEEFRERLQRNFEPEQIGIDLSAETRNRVVELIEARTEEFARWVWLLCKGTGTPIPQQMAKLLEPYVEEATALFTDNIRQRVRVLLAEQDQLLQEHFQATIDSLEGRISTLEDEAHQVCERNMDSMTKVSADRLDAVADRAASNLESRIKELVGCSFDGFQTRLDEVTTTQIARLQQENDQKEQGFIHRMGALVSEIEETKLSEFTARTEQTAAQVMESNLQQLHQQSQESEERSKEQLKTFLQQEAEEIRGGIQQVGRSVHESVEQGAARVVESLQALDQSTAGLQGRRLAEAQERLACMVQETMESFEPRIQQIAETHLERCSAATRRSQDEEVSQFEMRLSKAAEEQCRNALERIQQDAGNAASSAAAQVESTATSAMQDLSDKVNASAALVREQQEQASLRFGSSMQDTLNTFRQQLTQVAQAGMDEHRRLITKSVTDLQNRLNQAAEFLFEGIPSAP